jgi:phosphatidylglycerophosphate synthase
LSASDLKTLGAFLSLRYAAGGSPLTQILSQRIGAVLAWGAYRAGLSPSQVTCCGIATFLISAFSYAWLPGGWDATIVCLLLLHLGYGFDCADGQLARATTATSRFGGWLDVACDYLRNVFLALALAQHLIVRGFSTEAAIVVSGLLLSGNVVKLHTISILREGSAASSPARDRRTLIRDLGKLGLDTATHLTAFALLREAPSLLAAYAIGVGLAYTALACMQARQRLR